MAELEQKLRPKQELFCEAYTSNGFNAKQAAIEAGYSEHTSAEMGYENLNKPHVKAAIDEKLRESAERLGAGRDWRMQMLKDIAEISKNGGATKEGYAHPTGVIGAVSELNRMCGSYDKGDQDGELPATRGDIAELMKQYRKPS